MLSPLHPFPLHHSILAPICPAQCPPPGSHSQHGWIAACERSPWSHLDRLLYEQAINEIERLQGDVRVANMARNAAESQLSRQRNLAPPLADRAEISAAAHARCVWRVGSVREPSMIPAAGTGDPPRSVIVERIRAPYPVPAPARTLLDLFA